MVETYFLRKEHKGLWEVANTPEEVIIALNRKDRINEAWRRIAKI